MASLIPYAGHKKTKIMCISRQGNHNVTIGIHGQQVEQVDQFKYSEVLFQQMGSVGLRCDVALHWINQRL